MKQALHPSFAGLNIWRVYGIAKVLLMQLPSCDTVSPNSAVKHPPFPCSLNKYLAVDDNGLKKCSRCSVCPKGFQALTGCGIYNDTICEPCPSGWYNDVTGSSCKPCSGCNPGEYIRRDCSEKRDTSCRTCPRDTYSRDSNATLCIPCRRCKQNEKTVAKCNTTQDFICGECEYGKFKSFLKDIPQELLKGYFRVSSTGSCLPCSHCPAVLKHLVVPECRERLGIHHPDICWPAITVNTFPFFDIASSTEVGVTSQSIKKKQENLSSELVMFLILSILGSVMCCLVIIILVFICIRLLWGYQRFPENQPVSTEQIHLGIPMRLDSIGTGNYESGSESSKSRSRRTFPFESKTAFCDDEESSMGNLLESVDKSLCCEDTFSYIRDFDTRADSVPVFTTRGLMTSGERLSYDKHGESYGGSSQFAQCKPLYSEHRIYQTV